jgi:hypothetical protein
MGRDESPDVPARTGVLDLDDLCPELGQLDRTERSGAVLLDREDAQVGEREPAGREMVGILSVQAGSRALPVSVSHPKDARREARPVSTILVPIPSR